MRFLSVLLLAILSGQTAFGEAARSKVKAETSPCRAQAEKLIRSTANAMGLTTHFGVDLQTEDLPEEGGARRVRLFSGPFIIEMGYVSNTSAEVEARVNPNGSCKLTKVTVNLAN